MTEPKSQGTPLRQSARGRFWDALDIQNPTLDALARIEAKLASLYETVDGIGKAVDVIGRVQDRQTDRIASIDITVSRIREESESISDMLSGRQETTEADDTLPTEATIGGAGPHIQFEVPPEDQGDIDRATAATVGWWRIVDRFLDGDGDIWTRLPDGRFKLVDHDRRGRPQNPLCLPLSKIRERFGPIRALIWPEWAPDGRTVPQVMTPAGDRWYRTGDGRYNTSEQDEYPLAADVLEALWGPCKPVVTPAWTGADRVYSASGALWTRQEDGRYLGWPFNPTITSDELETLHGPCVIRKTTEADDSPAPQTLADLSATLPWLEPEDLIQWATVTADEADITESGHWPGGAETALTPGHADRIVREATEARRRTRETAEDSRRSYGPPDDDPRAYLCDTSSYLVGGSTTSLTDDAGEPEGGDCA